MMTVNNGCRIDSMRLVSSGVELWRHLWNHAEFVLSTITIRYDDFSARCWKTDE